MSVEGDGSGKHPLEVESVEEGALEIESGDEGDGSSGHPLQIDSGDEGDGSSGHPLQID